jgi:hypothetical protein|tara:strand:+ start:497 stop:754 length:258 start_codon:yes stop_codon:yes gene_type:complete
VHSTGEALNFWYSAEADNLLYAQAEAWAAARERVAEDQRVQQPREERKRKRAFVLESRDRATGRFVEARRVSVSRVANGQFAPRK